MLTPDQLKPHLMHEDRYVRFAVLDYFASMWTRDPGILPMAIEALGRFGEARTFYPFHDYYKLAVDERGLDAVLSVLPQNINSDINKRLNLVILHAPVELLAAREDVLRENPGVQSETIRRFEDRRALADQPAEKLWQSLQDLARSWDNWQEGEDLDEEGSDALIDALARRASPDDETIVRLLEDPAHAETWLEILLARLAGLRRISHAVPALVSKLHSDADFLLEECEESLMQIGDPKASRLIRAAFPGAGIGFKIFASNVLGKIKHPDSEDHILALLETEEDEGIRTALCQSLCELFSERGIEIVRQEIRRGYDQMVARLEDELLPVLSVLGIKVMEIDTWERERERENQRLARVFAELEAERVSTGTKHREAPMGAPQGFPFESDEDFEGPANEVTMPIRRTERKVGRNDPCPCGSGKKFKKCCGRGG
jgi:hypothetical protein